MTLYLVVEVVSDWMLRLSRDQEVTGHHACSCSGDHSVAVNVRAQRVCVCVVIITLVDQLVERMLTIGSRLSPHDWPSVVVYTGTLVGDVLSIGLHVALVKRSTE